MPEQTTYTAWKITCHSTEEVKALQQWLSSRIELDRVVTDTVRVTPNGVEQVQTVRHRLGGYLSALQLSPRSQQNPASCLLVLPRRPDARRFCRDGLANI